LWLYGLPTQPLTHLFDLFFFLPSFRSSSVQTHQWNSMSTITSNPCVNLIQPLLASLTNIPLLGRDVTIQPIPPTYVIQDGFTRVEVQGSTWFFFAVLPNGTVFRDEYLVLEFNSLFQQYHRSASKGLDKAHEVISQHRIQPFYSFASDNSTRKHTFLTTIDTGARIELTLEFGLEFGEDTLL